MDLGIFTFGSVPEVIATIVLALVGIALGLRKIHSIYANESVTIAKTNGQLDIITLLREQIQDLAQANKELRQEIESLRKLNNILRGENDDIKFELQKLRQQILEMKCPDCPAGDRFLQQLAPTDIDNK